MFAGFQLSRLARLEMGQIPLRAGRIQAAANFLQSVAQEEAED